MAIRLALSGKGFSTPALNYYSKYPEFKHRKLPQQLVIFHNFGMFVDLYKKYFCEYVQIRKRSYIFVIIFAIPIFNIMMSAKLGKSKKKTTTEIICENLGLSYQTIFQDYKCTMRQNLPYFGRLYIGEEHLMFVSNMFGIVKKIAIVIDSISKLSQPSLETIVVTGRHHKSISEEDFSFSGFKNENAYKIIRALWKKEKLESEVLNSNEEETEQSEKGSRNLDDGNIEINLFNAEKVETEKQKMLQIVLPCSVDQFYSFFLADDANVYSRKKHLQLKKANNIVVTPWKKNDEMNAEVRELNAMLKVKGVPFRSQAPMNQVWLLSKRTSEQLSLKIITQIVEIPYSSYFHVEENISITKQTDAKCKCVILTGIVFNKSTYMKGAILSRTFEDLQMDYKNWSDNVKEVLEKMKKQQQDDETKPEKKKNSIQVEFQAQKMEPDIVSPIKKQRDFQIVKEVNADIATLTEKVKVLIKICKILVVLVGLNLLVSVYHAHQL